MQESLTELLMKQWPAGAMLRQALPEQSNGKLLVLWNTSAGTFRLQGFSKVKVLPLGMLFPLLC